MSAEIIGSGLGHLEGHDVTILKEMVEEAGGDVASVVRSALRTLYQLKSIEADGGDIRVHDSDGPWTLRVAGGEK